MHRLYVLGRTVYCLEVERLWPNRNLPLEQLFHLHVYLECLFYQLFSIVYLSDQRKQNILKVCVSLWRHVFFSFHISFACYHFVIIINVQTCCGYCQSMPTAKNSTNRTLKLSIDCTGRVGATCTALQPWVAVYGTCDQHALTWAFGSEAIKCCSSNLIELLRNFLCLPSEQHSVNFSCKTCLYSRTRFVWRSQTSSESFTNIHETQLSHTSTSYASGYFEDNEQQRFGRISRNCDAGNIWPRCWPQF